MPWTSTRVSRSTRMLTERIPPVLAPSRARAHVSGAAVSCGMCRANGLRRRLVHAVAGGQPGFGQEAPPFLGVSPGESHDDWHRDSDSPQGFRDALRHDVSPCDAAENIDENGAHARVGGHEAERFGDLIGARTAADVEKVGRLPTVKHHGVHGGHRQAGAINDAPDVTTELDKRDPGLARVELSWVFGVEVA